MGQGVGMWSVCHGCSDQQRSQPPNIAGSGCPKGKRRFWMVLILQFGVWTGYDIPHLHKTLGPERITCSHPPMTESARKGDLSIFPVTEGQKYLGKLLWWLPNQEVCCGWRWGMWRSESAFEYLDQMHTTCRWQGSGSGLSGSSTQAFKS